MKKTLKRWLSLVLALTMCLSLVTTVSLAAEPESVLKFNPETDMVLIDANPDFNFYAALPETMGPGKTPGEASPIENDYYMSKYYVTCAQYKEFCDATGTKYPSYWTESGYPEGKADHPVLYVTYTNATEYCAWLSKQYDGWTFRLPTEAEWENACYADSNGGKFPWGNNSGISVSQNDDGSYNITNTYNVNCNTLLAAVLLDPNGKYGPDYKVTYIKDQLSGTETTLGELITLDSKGSVGNWANHATGVGIIFTDLFAEINATGGTTTAVNEGWSNSYGLYDCAGNAWAWTASDIVATNGAEAGTTVKAVRGGSWYATLNSCCATARGEGRSATGSGFNTISFRLAADYEVEVGAVIDGDVINETTSYPNGVEIKSVPTSETGLLTMTVNNKELPLEVGTYAGNVVITVTDYFTDGNLGSWSGKKGLAYRAALYVNQNKVDADLSVMEDIFKADGMELITATPGFSALIIKDSDYTLSNADIKMNTDSDGLKVNDFAGLGAGVAVYGDSFVTIEDSVIATSGVAVPATFVDSGADLVVYRSELSVAGGDIYSKYKSTANQSLMVNPPWVLGISGSARTTNVMGPYTTATYVDTTIKAADWGAVSIDTGDYMRIVLLNSDVVVDGSGYGAYAIGSGTVEDYYGVNMDVETYAVIMTGATANFGTSKDMDQKVTVYKLEADETSRGESKDSSTVVGTFASQQEGRDSVINSDNFGFMFHHNSKKGWNILNITDNTTVNTGAATFLVKKISAEINLDEANINSENGVILQMIDNDDDMVGAYKDEYFGMPTFNYTFSEGDGWSNTWMTSKANDWATELNVTNTELEGDVFNGTGYTSNGASKLTVNLGKGASLAGHISLTAYQHDYKTFTYYDEEAGYVHATAAAAADKLGHVTNTSHNNGAAIVDVVITDDGVWTVSSDETGTYKDASGKDSTEYETEIQNLISSLTIASESNLSGKGIVRTGALTVGGKAYEDGIYTINGVTVAVGENADDEIVPDEPDTPDTPDTPDEPSENLGYTTTGDTLATEIQVIENEDGTVTISMMGMGISMNKFAMTASSDNASVTVDPTEGTLVGKETTTLTVSGEGAANITVALTGTGMGPYAGKSQTITVPVTLGAASEVETAVIDGDVINETTSYPNGVEIKSVPTSDGLLTLTVNGVEYPLENGTYEGNVVITVTDKFEGAISSYKNREADDYRTALYVDGTGLVDSLSVYAAITSGEYDNKGATGLNVEAYSDSFSGVLVNGGNYTLSDSKFVFLSDADGSLDKDWVSSNGKRSWKTDGMSDFAGFGAVIGAFNDSYVLVDNVDILSKGVAKLAMFTDGGSDVVLTDSTIETLGGVLYADYISTADQNKMVAPPWVLGITGNARTTNLEGQNTSFTVVGVDAYSEQWGVLSTDAGANMQMVMIDTSMTLRGANGDNDPYTTKYGSGYATYMIGSGSNGPAKEYFYGCDMYVGTFATISTGGMAVYASSDFSEENAYKYSDYMAVLDPNSTSKVVRNADGTVTVYAPDKSVNGKDDDVVGTFSGEGKITTVYSEGFGVMTHSNGGDFTITDGTVFDTQNAIFLLKGGPTTIYVNDKAQLNAADGVILQMMDNDDTLVGVQMGVEHYNGPTFNTVYTEPEGYPGIDYESEITGGGAATVATFEDVTLVGDFYNATGYFKSTKGRPLTVNLGKDTELTGLITSSSSIHVDENGEQICSFTEDEYYYMGRVANKAYFNGVNTIDVVLSDNAVWNVTGESILNTLTVASGAKVNGVITADETTTAEDGSVVYSGNVVVNVDESDEPDHDLVHVEAVAPGCHCTGNVEHWYCKDCGTVWTDEALTRISNHQSVILPATGSDKLVHMEAVAPGCHYNGNIEYWVCYDCEQVWADEALTQLTNIKNVVIAASGSENLKHVAPKAPTCEANGNIEYWVCEDCEQVWADEALTQLTNIKNVVVAATGHSYGENGKCSVCGDSPKTGDAAPVAMMTTLAVLAAGAFIVLTKKRRA